MLNRKQNIDKQTHRKLSSGSKLLRFFAAALGALSFAAIVLFVTYTYFGSPKELMLKKQGDVYAQQLLQLNNQINNLSMRLVEMEKRDDKLYRPFYNLVAMPAELRQVGFGGSDRYASLKGYHNSESVISTARKLDYLARKLYIQQKSFKEIDKQAINKKKMLASIPAIQPISVGDLNYISSYFGFRDHPKLHRWIKHTGIDYAAPKGTPIYATGNGVVKHLKSSMSNYGKVVVINHGYGYESLYAHMSKRAVQPGDRVKRGQVIGYVGRTGRVTGVHLHYEVLKDGRSINPRKFYDNDLSAKEYDQMISILSL